MTIVQRDIADGIKGSTIEVLHNGITKERKDAPELESEILTMEHLSCKGVGPICNFPILHSPTPENWKLKQDLTRDKGYKAECTLYMKETYMA